jgi:hypothetical protein
MGNGEIGGWAHVVLSILQVATDPIIQKEDECSTLIALTNALTNIKIDANSATISRVMKGTLHTLPMTEPSLCEDSIPVFFEKLGIGMN